MTRNKVEKRAVRERMAKTGERYTTARHYLLDLHHPEPANDATEPIAEIAEIAEAQPVHSELGPTIDIEPGAGTATAGTEPAPPPAWIEQPGMSDEAILRNTGKTWDEWFALLDAWGATERTHTEIARYVYDTHNPGGWWAQGITVGYERARGMRKRHEHADGFSISASKTVAVPVERLFAAFVDASLRDQWLEPGTVRMRTSQPPRSARFDVSGAGTLLAVNFIAKGDRKSTVQLEEQKLPAEDQVAPRKALWKARLAQLATLLTT